jgi:hypothetical protein
VDSDLLEQKHQQKDGQIFSDFEMFVHSQIEPDEVLIMKVEKISSQEQLVQENEDAEREK